MRAIVGEMSRVVAALLFANSLAWAAPLRANSIVWPQTATALSEGCQRALDDLASRTSAFARAGGKPRFGATVLPLESAVSEARDATAPSVLLARVSSDAALRDAAATCAERWRYARIDLEADPNLARAIAAAVRDPSPRGLEERRLGALWMQRLRRGGATLGDAQRSEFVSLAHRLADAERDFDGNLERDRPVIRLDRSQARNLPNAMVGAFERKGDGSYEVPVDDGTLAFLRYASSEDAREAFYRAYERRGGETNVALLQRAIELRDRMAHLLGFESWADYRLAPTAIGSLAAAQQFCSDTATAVQDAARKSFAGIEPWDLARTEYLTEPRLQPRSVANVLDAVATAFGIRFDRSSGTPWFAGANTYAVSDATTGERLGALYLDLGRRLGKAQSDAVIPILLRRTGQPPAVAILAYWPLSSASDSELDPAHVTRFERDLGVALAAILARVSYESLAEVPRDAAEVDAAVVESVAGSGERSSGALETLHSIALAQIDLTLHSSGSHVNATSVYARTAAALLPPLYDAGTFPQTANGELMNGWDVRWYARPWGEAYARDVQSALVRDGSLDDSSARRYRLEVFAPSDSRELLASLRAFLGRDARPVIP